jgi:hypothetical protein
MRLNFDLITGFSLVPLQMFSMFGMLVSFGAVVTYLIVIVERLVLSGWHEGLATLWDRDILAFFLIGMLLFGLGLVGEYVGASTSRCVSGRASPSRRCWNRSATTQHAGNDPGRRLRLPQRRCALPAHARCSRRRGAAGADARGQPGGDNLV